MAKAAGSARKKGKAGRGGGSKNGLAKAETAQKGDVKSGALASSISRKDIFSAIAIAIFAVYIAGPRLPSLLGGWGGGGGVPPHQHRHDVDTEVISPDPRIFLLRNILSSAECDEIVKKAARGKRVASTTGGENDDREWRKSTTGWIRKDKAGASSIVRTLLSRVASAANVSVAMLQAGNPLHVTEYGPGGFYLPHLDSRHVEDLDELAKTRDYGDRADGYVITGGYPYTARRFTVLCYLSDGYDGGNTVFPLARRDGHREAKRPMKGYMKAMGNPQRDGVMEHWDAVMPPLCEGKIEDGNGISIPTEKGSCVLFYNHLDDEDEENEDGSNAIGQLDHLSLHAGCPIDNGSKWIVNVWGEDTPSEAVRTKGRHEAAEEKAQVQAQAFRVEAGKAKQKMNIPVTL